jgi:hypothetical protein
MVYEVWSYYCRRPHTIGKELTVNRLSWCIQSRVIQDQKKWTQNVEGYMWGLPKTGPMSVWMSETDPIFRWHVEKNSTHVTLRLPDLSVLITSDGSEDELFKFDRNPKKEIFVIPPPTITGPHVTWLTNTSSRFGSGWRTRMILE